MFFPVHIKHTSAFLQIRSLASQFYISICPILCSLSLSRSLFPFVLVIVYEGKYGLPFLLRGEKCFNLKEKLSFLNRQILNL